jgi:cell division initiation protein
MTNEFRKGPPMSDLDLPLLPSAEQIRRRQFATVRRGFDPDQVQDYLNQVATQVEALEKELREQRLQVGGRGDAPPAPAPPPAQAVPTGGDPYEELSARLASVLRAADEQAQHLVGDARAEAKKLLDEAQAEADAIKVGAQASAEEARAKSAQELERAREEADRILGGLDQRRDTMLKQMHEMQTRLRAVAQNLEVPEVDDAAGAHAAPAAPGSAQAAAPTPAATTPAAATPAAATPGAPAPAGKSDGPDRPTAETEPERPAPPPEPTAPPVGSGAKTGADAVDPRYEDMWGAGPPKPSSVDLPDLSSIDIDFDDDDAK